MTRLSAVVSDRLIWIDDANDPDMPIWICDDDMYSDDNDCPNDKHEHSNVHKLLDPERTWAAQWISFDHTHGGDVWIDKKSKGAKSVSASDSFPNEKPTVRATSGKEIDADSDGSFV